MRLPFGFKLVREAPAKESFVVVKPLDAMDFKEIAAAVRREMIRAGRRNERGPGL